MKKKNMIAVLMASVLGLSAMPTAVWAADSYKEAEKAAVAEAIEAFGAEYARGLAQYQSGETSGSGELKISLGESGRVILGMLAPVDVSWLNDASFDVNAGLFERNVVENMDIKVNGTTICTAEYYMDTETSEIYIRIPEINDGYMKMNLEQLTESAGEVDAEFSSEMDLSLFFDDYFTALENMPEADVMTTLLNRYAGLILDQVADGEAQGTQSVQAGGVAQELTVLEGVITEKEAYAMVEDVLTTAKDDEELKALIETWTEVLNDPEYTYDTFLEAIAELEAEMGEPSGEAVSGFGIRAWVNDADEIVGRELVSIEDDMEESLFSYVCTADGTKRGLALRFGADYEEVSLEGSGELTGDLLNGTYTLAMDGEDAFVIDVSDFDTKALSEGIWKGTYTLSGAEITDESGSSYDPLGGMQLIFVADGADKDSMEWKLSLAMSGEVLGTISLSGGPAGEAVEMLDPETFTDVYDMNAAEDMEAYSAGVTIDVLMENLTAAGMPEGWLESVMAMMDGSDEDMAYAEDGIYEEGVVEDQTDMAGDLLDDSEAPAA